MLFEKTEQNLALLNRLEDEKRRELSLVGRIQLAKDLMKKPDSRAEYELLEKTVKDLERQLELEKKGLGDPVRIAPLEQLKDVFGTAEEEFDQATREYIKLQKQVMSAIETYLAKVEEPLKKMSYIETTLKRTLNASMSVNYEFVVNAADLRKVMKKLSVKDVENASRRLKEAGDY